VEFSQLCGACNPNTCQKSQSPQSQRPPTTTVYNRKCGCDTCTNDILQRDADGYTCEARMNWVKVFKSTIMGSDYDTVSLATKMEAIR
jgi:hypothetical protein